MMKRDGFQHYKNIHVVDLSVFGVLLVLALADCVLGFFGSRPDIQALRFVCQLLAWVPEGIGAVDIIVFS
jgi:hypothetical protein